MGVDDANEGGGDGECIEHVWQIVEVEFGLDGGYLQHACQRCGATSIRLGHGLA